MARYDAMVRFAVLNYRPKGTQHGGIEIGVYFAKRLESVHRILLN